MVNYVPNQGDIIYIDFDPQAGHEQAGKRPALVISNREFFEKTKMAMVCPVSTKVKGFPLHVALPEGMKTKGLVLCEHLKSLDITARNAKFVEELPKEIMEKIKTYIIACMQ